MTPEVFEQARALAVLVGCRFAVDACADVTSPSERSIDVRHAHLDDVRDDACAWSDLFCTDVGDDDGTVLSDPQLGAVRIADPYPFRETKGGLQPRDRRSYVRIDEHRSDSGRRRRTIGQHGRET